MKRKIGWIVTVSSIRHSTSPRIWPVWKGTWSWIFNGLRKFCPTESNWMSSNSEGEILPSCGSVSLHQFPNGLYHPTRKTGARSNMSVASHCGAVFRQSTDLRLLIVLLILGIRFFRFFFPFSIAIASTISGRAGSTTSWFRITRWSRRF